MPHIVVAGSINIDMVMKTKRFPDPGETVLGGTFFTFHGGKGANQAVAAARLGGEVTFIARVGNDAFGKDALANLSKEDIDIDFISVEPEGTTGIAQIVVADSGQNQIIVASGANGLMKRSDIDDAAQLLKTADLILVQLEIPTPVVEALVLQAQALNCPLILNPAPAQPFKKEWLSELYLLTPNESEAGFLTGIEIKTISDAERAAGLLRARGVQHVVITMGSVGTLYKGPKDLFFIKSNKVLVRDTTGAGDTFNGALAVALAEHKDWRSAIQFATDAAGIAVTRMGAQSSIPYRKELEK